MALSVIPHPCVYSKATNLFVPSLSKWAPHKITLTQKKVPLVGNGMQGVAAAIDVVCRRQGLPPHLRHFCSSSGLSQDLTKGPFVPVPVGDETDSSSKRIYLISTSTCIKVDPPAPLKQHSPTSQLAKLHDADSSTPLVTLASQSTSSQQTRCSIVSPWHHVPLWTSSGGTGNDTGVVNMVVEISKMSKAKMEIQSKVKMNPIAQDKNKDGSPRWYHGPIFWNYGALPQTWEDPHLPASGGDTSTPDEINVGVDGLKGDNDPLDVVEVGAEALTTGVVIPVKVIGALCLVDSNEVDWKIIAIRTDDPHCASISSAEELERFYPHTISGVREWFRWYKKPDGVMNRFGCDEKVLSQQEALTVIALAHTHYRGLLSRSSQEGLWVPSEV
eukprot:GHVN01008157.1.p1 GENE.GHVN01008157.1~~GHVN01008157.1.p1  ORF type:complete len:426 (+),score=84.81 GHVN01008157.1:118-1278(+)